MTIRAGRIEDTLLTARKIGEIERMICAAPSYLERRGVPRSPADLAKHSCILIAVPGARHWPFQGRNGIEYFEITPSATTDNGEVLLQLALEGGNCTAC